MINARQAKIYSTISKTMNDDVAYKQLMRAFTMMLKVYCAKGEYSMTLRAEKYQANNEQFIQELISNGYSVQPKHLSYNISW